MTGELAPGAAHPRMCRECAGTDLTDRQRCAELGASLSLNARHRAQVVAHPGRLRVLVDLLRSVGVSSLSPLNARFVRSPLTGRLTSLLSLVTADYLDCALIISVVKQAVDRDTETRRAREAHEAGLRARGFDDVTRAEKRANLALNTS